MKVITLHKTDFEGRCQELFSKIDVQPDVVVGILNGGGFILKEYQKIASKNTEVTTIKLQRDSTKGLKKKSLLQKFLKASPSTLLDGLRRMEHRRNLNRKLKEIQSDLEIKIKSKPETVNTILILDDALDSGITIKSVIQSLQNQFPNSEIKTAVISWTNSKSIIAPDYYIFKNTLVRFPWSLDYKSQCHE
ncbi:hypoxanthine phosphoribosyltransferase [Winogradskyella wandonensis]|uniref:Hypoxanthine phosphoribosyltransferase n=1 Tax=Winogradskyella wandonensis TaxID=1442586 RepID=A0A4R1KU62_9FLAO|nr:phosphoribosyltransferase family protein [Winogradskyella wandonensis]TCK68732.1 hypoxanthine phosphoribosyltransferase [Winogradskyella wandonensis]